MTTIHNIRKQAGLTEQEMASWLGITRSWLRKAEKGGNRLNATTLQRMARLDQCLSTVCTGLHKNMMDTNENLRFAALSLKLKGVKLRLRSCESAYEKKYKLSQLITLLKLQEKEEDKLWVELMHYNVQKKLHALAKSIERLRENVYLLTAVTGYMNQIQSM